MSRQTFGGRLGVKAACLVAVLGTLLAGPVPAQTNLPGDERPWYVTVSRYGKWLSLAAAAGLVTAAAVYDSDAQNAIDALSSFCKPDPMQCQIVGSGSGERYNNIRAEDLFQESARLEGKSRSLLIGGQLAIVAAGSMFLIDLLYRDNKPNNIPFTSLEIHSSPGQLGLSVRF